MVPLREVSRSLKSARERFWLLTPVPKRSGRPPPHHHPPKKGREKKLPQRIPKYRRAVCQPRALVSRDARGSGVPRKVPPGRPSLPTGPSQHSAADAVEALAGTSPAGRAKAQDRAAAQVRGDLHRLSAVTQQRPLRVGTGCAARGGSDTRVPQVLKLIEDVFETFSPALIWLGVRGCTTSVGLKLTPSFGKNAQAILHPLLWAPHPP